jgi:hypothetical protein
VRLDSLSATRRDLLTDLFMSHDAAGTDILQTPLDAISVVLLQVQVKIDGFVQQVGPVTVLIAANESSLSETDRFLCHSRLHTR